MPWTKEQFSQRHNKKLHGEAAQKAANVATALVNKGEDEGKAIRIANSIGDRAMKKKKSKIARGLYNKEDKK